ncbi:MAG: large conductance mechanosensitive channel protein MscL [Planctomycetaceae bacterium]
MGLLKEFRDFAMKGNVVDMAVGIIIGGAFGKIVSSMVSDIMMPLLGAVMGKGSFGSQFLWLGDGDKPVSIQAAKDAGGAYIAWGPFVQTTIDFLIVAFAIFIMIKALNQAQSFMAAKEAEAPAPPPEPTEEVKLLREIRDSLARK